MTIVREASIEDAEAINQVSSYLGYTRYTNAESKRRLEEVLASTRDVVWVCEDETRITGWIHVFIALRLASAKFAEIGGFVVDKSYQRSGIGKKLVDTAIERAEQNRLSLRVWSNSERQAANQFYKSLGFKAQKTQIVHQQSSS